MAEYIGCSEDDLHIKIREFKEQGCTLFLWEDGDCMLEDKVREIFADMVVLKDPQRSEYFSNLSIPSYMRDWLVMKFSDDNGTID